MFALAEYNVQGFDCRNFGTCFGFYSDKVLTGYVSPRNVATRRGGGRVLRVKLESRCRGAQVQRQLCRARVRERRDGVEARGHKTPPLRVLRDHQAAGLSVGLHVGFTFGVHRGRVGR